MNEKKWIMAWGIIITILALGAGWSSAYIAEREGHGGAIRECQLGIEERLNLLEENEAGVRGNKAIAEDPKQPLKTKEARTYQYKVEQRFEKKRRERVDPAHGGKLVCTAVYPAPDPIPTPW